MIVGVYNSLNNFRAERKVEKSFKSSNNNNRKSYQNIVIDVEYEDLSPEHSSYDIKRIVVKDDIFIYDKKANLIRLNQSQRILAIV